MRRRPLLVAVLLATLAGCGTADPPASRSLESVMARHITRADNRPVANVTCTPRVRQVDDGEHADVTCNVTFADGTKYRADAAIINPYGGGIRYRWDAPPPADITRAKLPRPSIEFPADNAASFLHADNLRPTVDALTRRFSGDEAIVAMAIYPGEVEAVVADNDRAQLVTSTAPGQLTVSGSSSFDGKRTAIYVKQLNPEALDKTLKRIASRADVGLSSLDRAVLAFLPGDYAGWDIYPRTGRARFQARLGGQHLIEILPGETRSL